MNFFERQQVARRNSRVMVLLFALSAAGIVLGVDLIGSVTWLAFRAYLEIPLAGPPGLLGKLRGVPLTLHALVSGVTLFTIFAVSTWSALRLREGGGIAVAQMMDARWVRRGTTDPLERRLINVVDEMAIASGTRVPLVYVMDDQSGINAFAAGYDISRCVVVVTRGSLEMLNRDELQGVIGHEFSHIVNGDMALNIRMIGVLSGILFIGALGEFIMRGTRHVEDLRGVVVVFLFGLALFLAGYTGLFLGRLIKATVSREREFLADAAGVQFTRNPEGLAGALDQIRRRHSFVSHQHAEDVSHLFFGEALSLEEDRLFTTHPPIEERIRRIAPRFQAQSYHGARAQPGDALPALQTAVLPAAGASGFAGLATAGVRAGDAASPWTLTSGEARDLVGSVDRRGVLAARAQLVALPAPVQVALRDPQGARAMVLALLLAPVDAVLDAQLRSANAAGAGDLASKAAALLPAVREISPTMHLPIVDLALPVLRFAPEPERKELVGALEAVIGADRRVSIYRFAYLAFVRAQLEPRRGAEPVRYKTLAEVRTDAALLLSLVAHAGCRDMASAVKDFTQAFEAGAGEMGLAGQIVAVGREQCGPEGASQAMDRLRGLAPLAMARLVKGLFAAVTADGTIRVVEAALMRMIGAVLDCPLPPLLQELSPEVLET